MKISALNPIALLTALSKLNTQ